MIKIERKNKPPELTPELVKKLTRKYIESEKDVWNDDCIKSYLKKTLSEMSHEKCSYCECKLNIESKDATIDHIKPKSRNKNEVLEWDNLILSCLRCNRVKSNNQNIIINPCNDIPNKHLYLDISYRILGKKDDELGQITKNVLKLNDIDRVRIPRYSDFIEEYWKME